MIVEVQRKGHNITGLKIGAINVRRYFPRGSSSIDIHLDHLQIQCDLQPGVWQNEPHISDPRLSAWLEAKNLRNLNKRAPVVVDLVPADQRSFRLKLVS